MPELQNDLSETDQSHRLKANIVEALKRVYDLEIPVNIYDLGLTHKVNIARPLRNNI